VTPLDERNPSLGDEAPYVSNGDAEMVRDLLDREKNG
jgi:hypothetical protein